MAVISSDRLKIIDLARAISILAVMTRHFSFTGYVDAHSNIVMRFLEAFGRGGTYGVSLFFVISGFVISRMIDIRYGDLFSIDVRDFYVRRIARIWPLLYTVIVVGMSLVWLINMQSGRINEAVNQILTPFPQKFDSLFFASLFTFTANILFELRPHEYGMQWVILWSLAVEEQFYLLFPLVLQALQSRRRLIVVLTTLIILGPAARWLLASFGPQAAPIASFVAYDLLAMGVLLFITLKQFASQLSANKTQALLLFVVGAILATVVYFLRDDSNLIQAAFAPTLFGIGAFMCFLGGLNLPEANAIPVIVTSPGKLSYGMYLYHPFVLLLTMGFLQLPRLCLFAAFVGCNILLSACSFYMYEQPLNKLIYCRFARTKATTN